MAKYHLPIHCFFYLLNKDFNLKITLPGLEEGSQSLKIRLLPGNVNYYFGLLVKLQIHLIRGLDQSSYMR